MKKSIQLLILFSVLCIHFCSNIQGQSSVCAREKLLLDYGWSFKLGNIPLPDYNYNWWNGYLNGVFTPNFNDSSWRKVIELPFVNESNATVMIHGYKPIGQDFPETSKAIYRKVFNIPKTDDGKRILIKFDGIYRNSTIWINSFRLGNNYSGYSECVFDITDMVNYGGKNVLVVHVDVTQLEGWFYEGAGIYRHAWLLKTDPLHIPLYGTCITSTVAANSAKVNIVTTVFNQDTKSADCQLMLSIIDENGKVVGTSNSAIKLKNDEQINANSDINITKPELWSIERPYLYKLVSTIKRGNKTIDITETNFGLRTIYFDKDKGFFLNGKSVKIKGTCNHQDHAGVGSAMPDRLQYYRIEKLKEMGCNAYRTSHHPPTPELLEACDRLGMMVCDENRILGTSEERLELFKNQIIRDRNHPSVIMWSIGNEEAIQNSDYGKRIALTMMHLQKTLDPSRLCIYAANNKNVWEGINSVIDIRGYNYGAWESDQYHKDHPNQIMMGSEESSSLNTRGQYFTDTIQGFMSDYDNGVNGALRQKNGGNITMKGPILQELMFGLDSITVANLHLIHGHALAVILA
jgi:beta-galactosidase